MMKNTNTGARTAIMVFALMALVAVQQTSSQTVGLSVTPNQLITGTAVNFVVSCSGAGCSGPSNIIDYGSGTCQSAVPSGLPACDYSDISTTQTPCTVISSPGSTINFADTVSSSSSSTVVHNLCAYSGTSLSSPISFEVFPTSAVIFTGVEGTLTDGASGTYGCPTLALPGATLVPERQYIQPGAFDPVTLNLDIDLQNNPSLGSFDICGEGNLKISSPICPVTFYPCTPANLAPPLANPSDPFQGASYVSSYCATEQTIDPFADVNPCKEFTSSSSVFPYTPGAEGQGVYNLCFYILVTAVNSKTGELQAQASCTYYAYGYTGATANYVVSQYIAPNANVLRNLSNGALNANYYITQPLSIGITDSQGNPTQQVISPSGMTFTITGSPISDDQQVLGQYPLYMELSSPGVDNCEYGGSPRNYGPLYGGFVPACGPDPTSQELPCELGYSVGQSSLTPVEASTYSATIASTSSLGPGVYTVCGYEGDYPSNNVDPDQIFFTTNSFTLSCPPYNPTCGTYQGETPPPAVSISSIQDEACSLYLSVNQILMILAITLMLIGAIIYGGANTLPGQTRGQIQAYGFGLILAGVASLIIAAVSVYALTYVSGYSVPYILYTLNVCPMS